MLPLISSATYILISSLSGVGARAVNTTIISLPTSDISSSILADSGNGTASARRCGDIDNCRTLGGIVQSCLVTILACVWFAVHRNVPAPQPIEPRHPKFLVRCAKWVWRIVLDQREAVIVFVVTLLAPEWILAWALRQAMVAWKLASALEEARLQAKEKEKERCLELLDLQKDEGHIATNVDGHSRMDGSAAANTDSKGSGLVKRQSSPSTVHAACPECQGSGNQCDRVASERRVAKGDECAIIPTFMIILSLLIFNIGWKWSHAFLVAMGGFHFYNKGGPLYPLSPAAVIELVRRGHLVPPTADEISDKSKGDMLSKGVAMAQTLWFVVQCRARRAEHLPLTNLEVMTLAYTVMTIAMYITWWAKPLNISCAVRVPEEKVEGRKADEYGSAFHQILMCIGGNQDDCVDLRQCTRVPTFWAGNADSDVLGNANFIAFFVTMVFGLVHCIAWHSEFPSPLAQQLWRSSAIAITAFPALLIVALIPIVQIGKAFDSHVVSVFLGCVLYTLLAIIYVAARLILITLSFTSLRGLPFGAYQTVQWTTFIPHI